MAEVFEAGAAGVKAWQNWMRYQEIQKLLAAQENLQQQYLKLQGDSNSASNSVTGNKSGLRDVTSTIEKRIKEQQDFNKNQADANIAKSDTGFDLAKMLFDPASGFRKLAGDDDSQYEQLEMPEFNFGGAIAGNGAASNMTNSGDSAVAELAKKYGVKTNGIEESNISSPPEGNRVFKSGISADPEFNKDVDSYIDRGYAPTKDLKGKKPEAYNLIGNNFTTPPDSFRGPARSTPSTSELPAKVQPVTSDPPASQTPLIGNNFAPKPDPPETQTIASNFAPTNSSVDSGPPHSAPSTSRKFWEDSPEISNGSMSGIGSNFSPRSFTQ